MGNDPTSRLNLPLSANVSPREIDAGLRQFMLSVYNYMGPGELLPPVVLIHTQLSGVTS